MGVRPLFRQIVYVACFGCVAVGCAPLGQPLVLERSPSVLSSTQTYTVKRGDTLYSIAWRLSMNYVDLAEYNRITAPFVIYPGQELSLSPTAQLAPAASQVATARPAAQPAQSTSSSQAKKSAKAVAAKATQSKSTKTASTANKTADRAPQQAKVAVKQASQTVRSKPKAAKPPAQSVSGGLAQRFTKNGWIWPLAQRPSRDFGNGNKGLDFALARSAHVRAVSRGEVVYAGDGIGGYERLVIVKHSGELLSAYSFNGELLVAEQQSVQSGDRVAQIVPSRGRGQTLHFEIRKNGQPINPRTLLN